MKKTMLLVSLLITSIACGQVINPVTDATTLEGKSAEQVAALWSSQAATTTVDLATQDIINGGTITADDFVGDGSGLTNLPAVAEVDPIFTNWLATTPPVFTETDPIWSAVSNQVQTDITANNAKISYPVADSNKLAGIEAGATSNDVIDVTNAEGFLYQDANTNISWEAITSSDIGDFQTAVSNNSLVASAIQPTDSVTALSDVSSAGSGSIITSAERTKLGDAVTNDQPVVSFATGNIDRVVGGLDYIDMSVNGIDFYTDGGNVDFDVASGTGDFIIGADEVLPQWDNQVDLGNGSFAWQNVHATTGNFDVVNVGSQYWNENDLLVNTANDVSINAADDIFFSNGTGDIVLTSAVELRLQSSTDIELDSSGGDIRVDNNIIPFAGQSNTLDIGTALLPFRNVYTSTGTFDTVVIADSTNQISVADVVFDGHFIPTASNAFDLGSADNPVRDVYASTGTYYFVGHPDLVGLTVDENGQLSTTVGTNAPVASVKVGDNVSDLVNDAGYLTAPPVTNTTTTTFEQALEIVNFGLTVGGGILAGNSGLDIGSTGSVFNRGYIDEPHFQSVYLGEVGGSQFVPAEGESLIWQTSGGSIGKDGDIIIKTTAGGVTATNILHDFGATLLAASTGTFDVVNLPSTFTTQYWTTNGFRAATIGDIFLTTSSGDIYLDPTGVLNLKAGSGINLDASSGDIRVDNNIIPFAGTSNTYDIGTALLPFREVHSSTGNFDVVNLTAATEAWKAGQLTYDATEKGHFADTGYTNVRVNVGRELHTVFYNDTGATIENGRVLNQAGITNGVFKAKYLDVNTPGSRESFLGVCTVDDGVPDGQLGLCTFFGDVSGDYSAFTEGGIAYASTNGLITQTKPLYPSKRWIIGSVQDNGTNGQLHVQAVDNKRLTASKSYSWSSFSTATAYAGGFYDFDSTDVDMNETSPTTATWGNSAVAYSAHAAIVPSGAGSVDTGVVGLEVVGTRVDDAGNYIANSTNSISADITTLVADTYYETEKYIGTITFQFYVVSGSPTTYSLTFNYGYAKYEDIGNQDFTVTGLEIVGLYGQANTFNCELLHHKSDGWTYAATGFEPGNSAIADMTNDIPGSSGISGEPFAWKRTNLDTFIDGNGSEGVLWRMNAGQAGVVDSMDMHITGVSEEL